MPKFLPSPPLAQSSGRNNRHRKAKQNLWLSHDPSVLRMILINPETDLRRFCVLVLPTLSPQVCRSSALTTNHFSASLPFFAPYVLCTVLATLFSLEVCVSPFGLGNLRFCQRKRILRPSPGVYRCRCTSPRKLFAAYSTVVVTNPRSVPVPTTSSGMVLVLYT